MTTFTDYLWFEIAGRHKFVRIIDEVRWRSAGAVVSRVWWWFRRCPSPLASSSTTGRTGGSQTSSGGSNSLRPAGLPYRHHQTGEDNADSYRRTMMGHQIVVPVTGGALNLWPWEQIFFAEFDGRHRKPVVLKAMRE